VSTPPFTARHRSHSVERADASGDLRLFALAWAMGFVFFLVLLG
jgi:hypothetical protein